MQTLLKPLFFQLTWLGPFQPFQPFQFGLWKLFKFKLGVFPGIDKIIPVIYGNSWKEQTKPLTSYCGMILI